MMPDDRITVEQLVRVRIPSHEALIDLSLSDAQALHQGLDAIFQPRHICGWDPGDPQGSRQVMIRIPVTEPPAETGPSLQEDIEAMIAKASTDPTANLFDEIHEWQLATFPEASALSKFEHLKREIAELGEDITKPSEIADCMLLLIGLAKIQGINPIAAMREKLAVNKSRKWGEPDALGVVEHVREPDDADEQEAEFLSRLPQDGNKRDPKFNEPCTLLPVEPSNTLEPAAEPETTPEHPKPSNECQVRQRIPETAEEKAFRLWHQYRERHPEMPENRIVSRITAHYQGDRPSTDEVRGWLRARGVDLPEPLTRAQVAERMRAQRLAAAGERAEPPKAETPQAPEPVALSIDAFNPPSKLDWQDQLALTFEVLDNPDPDISSFWVAHCGLEAIEVYCNFVAKMRPAYKAMPPFKRTEFKEALSAKLRGKVAA